MRIIMFDMDGTLVDSGTSITNTINHVRVNLGFEKMEKSFALEKLNDPNISTSKFFYGTDDFTLQQKELFEDYYKENCLKELELYAGIESLLEDLSKDFTLAVATNANSFFAKKMLDHLNIGRYFQTILGYDSVKNPKPHPEMINKILDKHSMRKENAQVIGDSHKDILAAKNAGVDSVLVNWGFSNHDKDAIETIEELKNRIYIKFNS
ncbi:HAD family hydrolase [Halarcobacter ebronensis]|uniref:phosphoglycolate phosphatase n=1 Tax=Halarcobacter ebronensis TaxID=1462615 RepID=A0A4Q1ARQ5_9BACT|nr:HAD family hydrolase [Halarcobacter ebronensis]QKF82171.1 phosphoglycolate phosphatase-like HAD superfamily hydrolase [Halarcobacter ebronensis]RXK03450.1 HAD family hydrolase [Halarcobacter ebronensis]